MPHFKKGARVDENMDGLRMLHLRNVPIGDREKRGISGGEMQRVSIRLELVARPDVLLLEGPAWGLDSVSASKVANVLHTLAHDPDNPTAFMTVVHLCDPGVLQAAWSCRT